MNNYFILLYKHLGYCEDCFEITTLKMLDNYILNHEDKEYLFDLFEYKSMRLFREIIDDYNSDIKIKYALQDAQKIINFIKLQQFDSALLSYLLIILKS